MSPRGSFLRFSAKSASVQNPDGLQRQVQHHVIDALGDAERMSMKGEMDGLEQLEGAAEREHRGLSHGFGENGANVERSDDPSGERLRVPESCDQEVAALV